MYSQGRSRKNIRQKNIRRIYEPYGQDDYLDDGNSLSCTMICRFLIMIFRKMIHWIKIQSNSIYVSGDKRLVTNAVTSFSAI